MKITFADLWRPSGTIDRATYALVGLVGFALKHNLDRLLSFYGFHRRWELFNYWVPVRDVARITDLRSKEAGFLETMVTLALPFIWVGVVLTMKRLRSARLPPQLVALFFVPFLNLLFFLVLCLLPERELPLTEQKAKWPQRPYLTQILPEGALGSAAVALLITVPVGLGMVLLGVRMLMNYGWGLFVALPFTIGFAAALIYGMRQPRSLGGCVGVACLATALLGLGLLALAFEGIACLIMAMPIALPLAVFGAACGYLVQRRRWFHEGGPAFLSVLLIFVPGVQWTEHVVAPLPSNFVVRSAIDVHAPPERVWQHVIAFSEIPPPTEWLFRVGIAYPIRAEMLGRGPGAERDCVFSTGAFVEPIDVWDAPHRLRFSVTSNPAPMQEWTPYSHIAPPHLHGFLVSNGGQFLLTPLPNGWTRLEGTTWYRHGLWPSAYWRWWSDAIIHRIHLRVLKHIREEAENNAPAGSESRSARQQVEVSSQPGMPVR
ncbi:MAG: hypothetical protein DMG70_23145 [Acidobacteria bacterium]|nr:MAG: hypothetical protein DMG70_23145 [Acidobacteriota bacterium]PYY09441.1 MAG: hypothetical protein DMG69_10570 [Acidobacteriota bacterium]